MDHTRLTCWIDVFVLNQHNYMDELGELDDVINICANFIQCLDTAAALPLQRIWCIYEVYVRVKSTRGNGGLFVSVGSVTDQPASSAEAENSKRQRPSFVAASAKDIKALIDNIDVEKAEATYPDDVEKILSLIRKLPGGCASVNSKVREALVHCAVHNTLEDMSDALGAAGGRQSKRSNVKNKGKTPLGRNKVEDLYAGLENL